MAVIPTEDGFPARALWVWAAEHRRGLWQESTLAYTVEYPDGTCQRGLIRLFTDDDTYPFSFLDVLDGYIRARHKPAPGLTYSWEAVGGDPAQAL